MQLGVQFSTGCSWTPN
uniref:Uncharacterized protein n=1 Tax=Arundo donax TaxID=35708 RepID=A0A0A8Z1L3_ARUDO